VKIQEGDGIDDSVHSVSEKVEGDGSAPEGSGLSAFVDKVATAKYPKGKGEVSSSAPLSKKRVAPSVNNLSPRKKPSLKSQLSKLVLNPTIQFDPNVQVSIVPATVVPAFFLKPGSPN
jgi:hypothetical protein